MNIKTQAQIILPEPIGKGELSYRDQTIKFTNAIT